MEKDLDSKLYNEYFEGKKETFDLLYTKYKSKIEYFIFNIVKDYQKAEDLTQDTFIYIFQNKSDENYKFKNYIYLIAKSRAFSYINTKKRREEISDKYLKTEDVEEDILQFIIKEENKKELIEAIDTLDNKYRNAMYLVKIEELSYKETAEILGESVQNIKNLVHRGKKELKKILKSKGIYEKNKLPKILITILCAGILISGITFANEIIDILKENIFGTYDSGITTAIENGYTPDLNMEFIESNGIKVKVDSVLLDDYNLGIIYNIIAENEDYLKKINVSRIEFDNILIMDENNDILHADYENKSEFLEYCTQNNLDAGEYYSGYSTGGYKLNMLGNVDNKDFLISNLMFSEKFPESTKIYIKFDTIYFLNKKAKIFDKVNGYKKTPKRNCRTIKGDWEIEIDLNEVTKNRKTVEYDVVKINDDKTEVTKASLSMTNMRLELIINSDKIDFEKMKNRNPETMSVFDMLPFNDIYIETPDGEKFHDMGTVGTSYRTLEDGRIMYYINFDYTYFDRKENIKIHLGTNKREEINIELKANDIE